MAKGDLCIHHWVIEEPCGPYAEGRCKHCGETRQFVAGDDDPGGFVTSFHLFAEPQRRPGWRPGRFLGERHTKGGAA